MTMGVEVKGPDRVRHMSLGKGGATLLRLSLPTAAGTPLRSRHGRATRSHEIGLPDRCQRLLEHRREAAVADSAPGYLAYGMARLGLIGKL